MCPDWGDWKSSGMNRAIVSVGRVITAAMARGKEDQTGANPAGDLLALGCSSGSFTLLPRYRRPPAASHLLRLLSTWTSSSLGLHRRALALGGGWCVPRKGPSSKDTAKWRRDGRCAPAPRLQGAFWWHARYRRWPPLWLPPVKDGLADPTWGSHPNSCPCQ